MNNEMHSIDAYPVVTHQKVVWGDMDAFGHVNNVIYYRYVETARIEYLEQLNVLNLGINTVVASSNCKFLKPVFYPDALLIGSRVVEIRNSAFRMEYLIYSEKQNEVVAMAEAVIVCVDNQKMEKVLLPESVRQKIIETENKVGHVI